MPSIFTHSLFGLVAGRMIPQKKFPKKFWILSVLLPSLPDADVISFAFGISHNHIFAHRGFTHSIVFALLIGILTVTLFFRGKVPNIKRRLFLTAYFSLITASHGILDGLTTGNTGVAFFAPFHNARYFLPFTPIEDSPIGLAFFGARGYTVIKSEIIWVWTPVIFVLIITLLWANTFLKNKWPCYFK